MTLMDRADLGVALVSSRGTLRPFCISAAYLFDAHRLHAELEERGVKIGIATSVLAAQWAAAELYPLAIGGLICWAWAPETGTESLGEVAEPVQKESDDHTNHCVQQSR
jgi:hypothetical protein